MMPMPPARARAMARRASVTVSIAAETIGMASSMRGVSRVRVRTSSGTTDGRGRHQQHVVEGQALLGELRRVRPGAVGLVGERGRDSLHRCGPFASAGLSTILPAASSPTLRIP